MIPSFGHSWNTLVSILKQFTYSIARRQSILSLIYPFDIYDAPARYVDSTSSGYKSSTVNTKFRYFNTTFANEEILDTTFITNSILSNLPPQNCMKQTSIHETELLQISPDPYINSLIKYNLLKSLTPREYYTILSKSES